MSRQSISFTEPNDEWLKAQVESKEYSSSGFTSDSKESILSQSKSLLNG